MKSVLSIRYWLWGHTKHISALSHFFWFVYNLLCLLPFTGHKWLGSGTSGNRVLLYWCNRCSPAGRLWHRHIFCEVADTMGDSGTLTCSNYCCQFFSVLYAGSLLPLTVGCKNGWNIARTCFGVGNFLAAAVLATFYLLCIASGQLIFHCENIQDLRINTLQVLRTQFSVPALFFLWDFITQVERAFKTKCFNFSSHMNGKVLS